MIWINGAVLTIHRQQSYELTAWTLAIDLTAVYAMKAKHLTSQKLDRVERTRKLEDHNVDALSPGACYRQVLTVVVLQHRKKT